MGGGNRIVLKEGAKVTGANISVIGNDNQIIFHKNSLVRDSDIVIRGNNCVFSLGSNSDTGVRSFFGIGEDGVALTIGQDCMFSSDCRFYTTDFHSIVDDKNDRVNSPNNIVIGDHVWLGSHVAILKNTFLEGNNIVGTGSVVKGQFIKNTVIAGNPARIIKKDTNWLRERI